ncbi:helix-turn-helix domain-containing protein [Acholeplasma granularum]|uniref:helix-turn-helix domain-containing protein n=1 Tax=Acholeplasma granularum TaxID=264635 RepID=UPI000472F3E6|nr:helix-turn-helix domain-containing protein [Acholeplasma granularum]
MKENRSVVRLLEILDLISKHEEGLTLGQIYRKLNIPKSTAYDFLKTLYQYDVVYYKDHRLRNYIIGSRLYIMGSSYKKNSKLIESVERELKIYSNKYGKTTFINKSSDNEVVYIFKYQPTNSLIATSEEIGTVLSAKDKHPISQAFSIFNRDVSELSELELEIYRKGYIISDNGNSGQIQTIAVPIRNFENRVIGVISASDLYQEYKDPTEEIEELMSIGVVASKRLGYIESI